VNARLLRRTAIGAICGAFAYAGAARPQAPLALVAPAAAQEAVSGPQCTLRGTAPLTKGTQLFDARSGGRVIANFSGSIVPMTIADLPADPTTGRGFMRTSNGGRSLRLEGYVPLSAVPVFTGRDLPVVAGHVWLSSAHNVRLVRGALNSLTAELTIAGSQGQTVRASAACDAFSLQRGTPTSMETPGNGRGYLMKSSALELFGQPGGESIFTLRMSGSRHLFWSTEQRGGFVRVQSRADITIDAWARARDLEALKQGEMMDQLLPPQTAVTGAQLTLDKPPRLVRATKDIPVRARRDEKERSIGVIEVGAEVYVMETVAGWANVLPKGLGMTPPPEGGFWIPSAETPR
jgi:hypothetical protein